MNYRATVLVVAVAAAIIPLTAASATSPEEILAQIDAASLDPARAVHVENLKIDALGAELTLHNGTLYPATHVAGRTVEMVFLGDATLHVDPKDEIEYGQLELFTGSQILDEPITEAVMVVCFDAAADQLLNRPALQEPDETTEARAKELFAAWKDGKERSLLDLRASVLIDATGDPEYQTYFAGQFRSEDLGVFILAVEPDSPEQLSVGKFERTETSAKEEKKKRKYLSRQQRRGRLLGIEVEDLGVFDQWTLTSLRGADGKPRPGYAAFEPEHYDLDVDIDPSSLSLGGTATILLRPTMGTRRWVNAWMDRDLRVTRAFGPDGAELFFLQTPGNAYVLLDEAPETGSTFELRVDFEGSMLERPHSKVFKLRNTTDWYPHVGDDDRAKYDVKLSWPKGLDLVTMGDRVDSGRHPDGRRWEKRTLPVPADEFSFEIGKFDLREFDVGTVHVTLAFDRLTNEATQAWIRDQIAAVVGDSLAFFERIFGPYPLSQLTVVTVPRGYAQSLLGFVTFPAVLSVDLERIGGLHGLNDRRTVLAHELAHQWWGNLVGWRSYRDQWLSEAMANYSALIWARLRLEGVDHRGPIDNWRTRLTATLPDGRPLESVGPLTLGRRLNSSKADAYDAIVYQKGAVVLSMLSHAFGEAVFLEAQKRLVDAARFRQISTEDYIGAMATMTGQDLDWFARQYIHGTGLPEVSYRYEVGEPENGTWPITVIAQQHSPFRFRYRIEHLDDGSYDVRRESLGQMDVADSALVVPYLVALQDPVIQIQKPKGKKSPELSASSEDRGRLELRGRTTETEISCEKEPRELWLDPEHAVFGLFFSEERYPKRFLVYEGMSAEAAGDERRAEELLRKALATEAGPYGTDRERTRQKEDLDARARILLTRLYLDQGRLDEARETLHVAMDSVSGKRMQWSRKWFRALEARIAVREGDFEGALRQLKRTGRRGSLPTAGYLVLAIAAHQVGDEEALELATRVAERRGADLTALGEVQAR